MPTLRLHRSTSSLAIAAATCLMLVGCGNGDDGASPDDAAPVTATAETAPGGATTEPGADSGGGAAATTGLPDPCGLLTAADINAVTGGAYGEGEFNASLSSDFQSICEWHDPNGVATFVQVLVTAGADTVTSQRASAEDALGPAADVTVAGASDAYTVASGAILGMGVGDYFVQVSAISTSADDATPTTVALATVVAGNL